MEAVKFDSKYVARVRQMVSHVGDSVKKTFIGRYDVNGDVELVENGIIDTYAQIQSYADECSMDNILRRFANGDLSVLSQSQGIYADVSQYPAHFSDMVNMVAAVEREFMALPVDERSKYENNFVKYALAMSDTQSVGQDPAQVEKIDVVEKEVSAE